MVRYYKMGGNGFYSLFVDILGFSQLIETLSESDDDNLDKTFTDAASEAFFLNPGSRSPDRNKPLGKLFRLYRDFQHHLITNGQNAKVFARANGSRLSIFAFSDTAFIVSDNLGVLVTFLKKFIYDMYRLEIPIRGGLAKGSFTHLPLTSRAFFHSISFIQNPFLGSAIIRSYVAESKSKLKGLRIFIHPSASADMQASFARWIVVVPDKEKSVFVNAEFNFLAEDERLDFYLKKLDDMQRTANSEALIQYQSAREAIGRMRS